MPHELRIAREAEARDIGHDVVGARWPEAAETGSLQNPQQTVAPSGVISGKLVVISGRQSYCCGRSLLQGRRSADSQKIVDLAYTLGKLRRSHDPANPPASHAVRFGSAVDDYGAFAHPVERRYRDVLRAVVEDVLVDFIRDRHHIVLSAKSDNEFEFLTRKYFAGRIVRRIQHQIGRASCRER